MDDEATGYHLFLEPEGELAKDLSAQIRALASAYDGPVFPPHVTLLGPFEMDEELVLARATHLARELAPFPVALGALAGEPEFFRALYAEADPSQELLRAHARAQAVFGASDARPYRPHLSLFYGMLDDNLREQMKTEVILPSKASFLAASIHIYRTRGRASQWQRVAEVPF